MSKIGKLTAAQGELLVRRRTEWLAIGTSCEPADYDRAEATIRLMYEAIGRPPPRRVFRGTPLGCVLAGSILRYAKNRAGELGSQLGSQLWSQLRSQLESQLESQLRSQLESQLRSQLASQLGSQLESQLGECFWGQHEAAWVACYTFCAEIGVGYGIELDARLGWWADLARSCGWWWPYENWVLIADRPLAIRWDDAEVPRLHADGEPALEYRDGWQMYRWHGVAIPPEWGQRKSSEWDPGWLLTEQNAELRRVLLQGLGYERVRQLLGATVVHAEPTSGMELVRIARDVDVEPIVLLRVVCPSTGHQHTLRVPPHMTDCETARRWTFGDAPLTLLAET